MLEAVARGGVETARPSLPRLIPVYLFLAGFLVPIDLLVGDFRLSPYRLVALVCLIPCLGMVASRSADRLRIVDILMILHAVLTVLAQFVKFGAESWQFAGMFAIETLGPYFLARASIRSAADFRRMALFALLMVLVMLPFTVFEAMTGKHVLRTAFGHFVDTSEWYAARRMGLDRAYGPFEHPILYGVFCASLLGLAVFGVGRHRSRIIPWFFAAIVGAATFVSLSSGPLSTLIFQLYLIAWDKATVRIPHRWLLLSGILIAAYIAIDMLSNRNPFVVLSYYLTFDATTAYSRVTIYKYGFDNVLRNPLFGLGNESWVPEGVWASGSFDAFWLCQMMIYGVPSGLCLYGAVLVMLFSVGRRVLPPEIARLRKGWLITAVGLVLSGMSVAYWNAVYCWLMFLLGSGAWMLQWPVPPRAGARKPASDGAAHARRDESEGNAPLSVAGQADTAPYQPSHAPARFCRPEETRWVRSDD